MDVIIKNYHKEQSEEMEAIKRQIIKQIAQSPIAYVNIHRLGDLVTDVLYK